jgi:hypothetical protein
VTVSASGGDVQRWSRDGNRLFFYSSRQMMAANVKETAGTLPTTLTLTVNWPELRSASTDVPCH